MSKNTIARDRARSRRDGGYGLRVRAVLHEDAKARAQTKSKRKCYKSLDLYDFEQLAPFPPLLDFAAEGGTIEQLRIVAGAPSDSKAWRQRLERMKQLSPSHRLAAVVVPLSEVDHLELKTAEAVCEAEAYLYAKLFRLVDTGQPHSVAIKRGGKFDGTHAHLACQVESLSPELVALAEASPKGKGGGGLHSCGVHVCIVGDTEKDLDRLASYNSRDGDEALHLSNQNDPRYLAALSRKVVQKGIKAPSLIWHYPKRLSSL